MGFPRGCPGIGVMEETIGGCTNGWRGDLTNKNQRRAQHHSHEDWRGAYMGRLAQPACGLILSIRVAVRRNLQKENEGKDCQRERQWPRESSPGFLCKELHPSVSPHDTPGLPFRRRGPNCPSTIDSVGCNDLQQRCDF